MKVNLREDSANFLYRQETDFSVEGKSIQESKRIYLIDLNIPGHLSQLSPTLEQVRTHNSRRYHFFSTPEEVGCYLAGRFNEFSKSPYRTMFVYQGMNEDVFDSEGNFASPFIDLKLDKVHIEKSSADDTLDRIGKGFLEQIAKEK
jgi:hypothetical protein